MARTNEWTTTHPPGTELARNIDDIIRRLRLDIDERMREFIPNWADEPGPVVLADVYLGVKTSKQVVYPFNYFNGGGYGSEAVYETAGGRVLAVVSTGPLFCPIVLPPGVTIRFIDLHVNRGIVFSIDWSLYSRTFGSATAPSPLESKSVITAGNSTSQMQFEDEDGIVVDGNTMYYVGVEGFGGIPGASFSVYGLRVTYDTPNNLSTI